MRAEDIPGELSASAPEASAPTVTPGSPAPIKLIGFTAERKKLQKQIEELTRKLADAKTDFELQVDLIDPNPWQPRTLFDPVKMAELVESIANTGLVEPIVVRRVTGEGGAIRYQLVAGERRWRAHKALKKEAIRAVIVEIDDEKQAGMALAENVCRENLSDYEIYKAIDRAEDAFPSRIKMAEAIGVGRTQLYRYLSFEAMPDFIKADLEATPTILGSNGADAIARLIKKHGERVAEILPAVWKRVKNRKLDQAKITFAVESMLAGKPVQERESRTTVKIHDNTGHVASITNDCDFFTVKIKLRALSGDMEAELEQFIQEELGFELRPAKACTTPPQCPELAS